MRHRQLRPGQTRFSFACSCGVRLAGDVDSSAVEELTETLKGAHEPHRYEITEEAA